VAGPFAALAFGDDIRRGLVLQADLAAGRIPRYVIERRRPCPDGSTPWMRLTVSAVAGPEGAPDFFIAVAEDILAERDEDGARRETSERLRAALDASATGTFRWDLRTSAVQWDGHLDRLFGFPDDDVARSLDAFFARIHPDDRSRVLEHCWLRADEGDDIDVEFRVVRADGALRWLAAKGRAIRDVDGAPAYLAGACTDVTDRRQAADALQERETRFRTLADTIPQLAWMTDASGSIYWYNKRWYEYTGTALAEMRGWGWQALLHPDHVAQVVARIRRSFDAGESWEDTFPLRGRDGQYRWFLSRALPMHGTDGRMIGWFGTNTDVTDGHEAERAERAARLQAERATHLRDEVLAVVAHDLRNPVQTVAMSAESLLELPLDEVQQRRQLGIIRRAARGMTQLIADLLDAARIEAGTLSVHQARVDVGLLLAESFEQFEEDARTRGVTLICEGAAGIPAVLGDRDRLAQVLSNLLGNALKFTPSGGTVHLRSRIASPTDDRWVEIEVEDSGVGIAPDHLPHIFDRFWQAVRSTRAGAGLGLAIARGIVEAHGGQIRVESVPGQRTAFTFTLPTARRGDPDAA
jgi:PAS domain S-box-containing protein